MAQKPVTPPASIHSLRCTDEIWAVAQKRAWGEDLTMNRLLGELLEGYGNGGIDLPTVLKKYKHKTIETSA